MKKIPITLYLAMNATEDAQGVAAKYNLHPVTIQETYLALNAILKQFPEEAYNDFGLIHPDRIMILDSEKQAAPPEQPVLTTNTPAVTTTPAATTAKEVVSNADGASFKCGDKTSSADGTTPDTTNSGFTFDLKKNLPFIGVSALFLTGLIILAKNL